MKTPLLAGLALVALLASSGAALAQAPSGGPGTSAKANAAAKPTHTVNDGIARRGSNSFTEGQARGHIERAGYSDVTGLTKGADGVWRGRAMRAGASVEVGMDYKGNVNEGGPRSTALDRTQAMSTSVGPQGSMATASSTATTTTVRATHATASRHRHHRRHRRALARCAGAAAQGAACSGVDRNRNGVSDKEDRGARTGVAR